MFAPLTLRENAPLMALQKPYFDWFAHDNTLEVFNLIYSNDSVRLEVVPERLKYFSPGKAERVPGTAGVYVYDGLTVGTDSDTKWYMADFGHGSRSHRFHTVAFRGADGNEYVWLHLDYASLDFLMHPRPAKMDTAD